MKAYQKIVLLILLPLFFYQTEIEAQDTLSVRMPGKKTFKAEPFRATMLAMAMPGLGQIYNRKFWKVPFVYAGFGGLAYAIGFNSKEYNIFLKAYQDFTDNIPETRSYLDVIPNVDPSTLFTSGNFEWYKERLLRQADYFKRYRDLSYIGIAAWYLFTILDANVDASLFDYDVKDDLELKVKPAVVPAPAGPVVGLSLRVTF